jgi:membrane protease YdiL (CAAX protease family)
MSTTAEQLSDSAFISDLGPHEKSPWRFLLTLALGALAFVVAAFVAIFLSLGLLIAFAGWPSPSGADSIKELLRRFLTLSGSDGRSFGDALQLITVAIPSNVLPIYAVIGVAVLVHRVRLKRFITAAPKFRWRMLVSGVVLPALIIGPFVGIGQWLDPSHATPPILTVSDSLGHGVVYAIVCVLAFLPAAFGEEVLFRGWLLRQLGALTRNPAILIILDGAIFAAGHFQFGPDALLERTILGGAFAYMTLRLGGVEFSTGAHLANNLMVVLFLEPLTLKQPAEAGVTASTLIQYVYLVVSYVAMAELMARWAPLRRWAGVDQPAVPVATAAAAHFS